jgi:glycerol-3-phosphate O-acyltransferase 1/2
MIVKISHFSYLLRGLGAVYIKRKIDGADGKKDYIYRGVLQTYLQESLRAGHNLEFFIEGGRTRTGKPCMPKVCIKLSEINIIFRLTVFI